MNSPILTDNGRELLNRTLANKGIIKFSKMTISDNQIPKLSASIVGYNYNKENVYVVSSFTNENLATSFIVKILNIYAIDTNTGTEILYATSTNTTGDTFNSKDLGFQKKIYELYVGFSNSSQITIEINPSIGSEYTDNVREQIGIETGTFINLQNGFNGGLLLKELQGKSVQNGTPSPDNKADIVSVGDNGSVVVKVTGKNVLPRTAKTATTINGITFTPNSDGSITVNGTAIASTDFYFIDSLPYPVGNYIFSGNGLASGKVEMSVVEYTSTGVYVRHSRFYSTLKNDLSKLSPTNVIRVSLFVAKDSIIQNVTVYPQLELGTTSTAYEPYKEQLVTIPLTQPLRSVGSVYGRGCVKVNGVWGNERKFKKMNTSLLVISNTMDNVGRRISMVDSEIKQSGSIICTHFPFENSSKSSYSSPGNYITAGAKEGSNVIVNIRCDSLQTLITDNSTAVAWASANGLEIYVELATPVFEPYPQSLQDQLNKLQSYQGVTNVFTTDPQQPVMSVSYGKTDSSALALYGANVSDNKVDKSSVANNLITNVEGYALDARQGKALKESVDAINNNLASIFKNSSLTVTDANSAPEGLSSIAYGVPNSPFAFWSTLLTIDSGTSGYKQQVAYPWASGELRIAFRVCDAGTWYAWRYIALS